MTGIEQFLLKGYIPWTIHRDRPDHVYLEPAAECQPIVYPKPDGKLTFDRLSSVFISNTNHEESLPTTFSWFRSSTTSLRATCQ
jgi:electron-transferring-flavoprotein dehydrogenase